MAKFIDFTRNLFLDALTSIRGLIYGFLLIGLIIIVLGAILYLFLFIKTLM